MYTYSKATLYSAKLLWDSEEAANAFKNIFKKRLSELNSVPVNDDTAMSKVIKFIGDFGTHVLDTGLLNISYRVL